jgi:predicted GIY-YIG superfamily endonuclease
MRIIRTKFIWPGRNGWTFRNTVFIKRGLAADTEKRLLLHEAVHVEQYAEHGTVRFLFLYFKEYLVNLVHMRSHNDAYRAISFEKEARAKASEGS